MSCSCGPFETCPTCTPPPDAVAALEAAHHVDDMGLFDGEVTLAALIDAGWSLSHDSEREALVAAIPEDPRCADHTLAGECHWCGAALDDGDSHDPTCRWVKARAAAEGRP